MPAAPPELASAEPTHTSHRQGGEPTLRRFPRMRSMRFTPVVLLLAACASTPNVPAGTRGAGEAKRMIESTKDRSAYVPMLSDEQVYAAMPMLKGRKIPN